MKVILHEGDKYFLRFDSGEEVLGMMANFCLENKIEAGSWNAIGACAEVMISYYDLETKEYIDLNLKEDLEIISVTGNVAKMADKTVIHAHGCFSNRQMEPKAGHIKKLVVSATCEVALFVFKGKIERASNEKVGLNLIV